MGEAKIFGILNLTPDSFSEKGLNFNRKSALQTAEKFIKEGVYAIDIGAESTRAGSIPISVKEEIARLNIALPDIIKIGGINISIDTRNYETALWALDKGVNIINDVTGFLNENTIKLLKQYNAQGIFMHSIVVPHSREVFLLEEGEGMLEVIEKWAQERIAKFESLGVPKEKLIFDPGNGFGKKPHQSLFLIQNINYFKKLGVRILMGHSRKFFLSEVFKEKFIQGEPTILDKDIMTTVFSALLFKEIDFLRVHNVEMINILKSII